MDKETLSNYGWIVICVLVLAVMIALAGPFGTFVAGAVKSTTAGLFGVNQNAMNAGGITIPGQNFDDTSSDETPVALGCDTLYWDGNTEGLLSVGPFYKVSDSVLTDEQIKSGNMTISAGEYGNQELNFADGWETMVETGSVTENYVIAGEALCFIRKENTQVQSIVFEEPGIYFMSANGMHISRLTIPGYTGFPHSEHCGH